MGMIKKILFVIAILVFGLVATVMASTFQSESTNMSALDGTGNINWSGLFDSIERYKQGSGNELYVHPMAAVAEGAGFTDAIRKSSVFAGQGGALDSWGDLSGADQYINEKVSGVDGALTGSIGADGVGFDSISHLRFDTFGTTYSPVSNVPLPGSLWFLFSGFGTLLATRRWWRK